MFPNFLSTCPDMSVYYLQKPRELAVRVMGSTFCILRATHCKIQHASDWATKISRYFEMYPLCGTAPPLQQRWNNSLCGTHARTVVRKTPKRIHSSVFKTILIKSFGGPHTEYQRENSTGLLFIKWASFIRCSKGSRSAAEWKACGYIMTLQLILRVSEGRTWLPCCKLYY